MYLIGFAAAYLAPLAASLETSRSSVWFSGKFFIGGIALERVLDGVIMVIAWRRGLAHPGGRFQRGLTEVIASSSPGS